MRKNKAVLLGLCLVMTDFWELDKSLWKNSPYNLYLLALQAWSSWFLKWCEGSISFSLMHRSSHPLVLLGKAVVKICSKSTGGHPCQGAISAKLESSFIEITLWHGCSPVNLLHIFRTPFPKNISGWLLPKVPISQKYIAANTFNFWINRWW